MADEPELFYADKSRPEWWNCYETTNAADSLLCSFGMEAYCLTCWWHKFDDEKNMFAKQHKAEFPDHIVKTKAGLSVEKIQIHRQMPRLQRENRIAGGAL